jgi:2-polyprenyl-3-methyl-5-hydroxy-6-metoxy-1,4-benzoquinol methylase
MPKTVACNLCGGNETSLVQACEPPYSVVKCVKCGLVYTNPQPDFTVLEDHYQEEYYREWIRRQAAPRLSLWKKRVRTISGYKSSGRLLDVGCGIGTFLDVARTAGFDVYGTEVSGYAIRYIQETYAIEVSKGLFENLDFPEKHFDIITFWHSLEHVSDPAANLAYARTLLKDNGLLVLACPNVNNYIMYFLYRLVKGRRLQLFSPDAKEQHLFHFSEDSIKHLARKCGFRVKKFGPDLSKVTAQKKIIDWITAVLFFLTRKNFGEAFVLIAEKI